MKYLLRKQFQYFQMIAIQVVAGDPNNLHMIHCRTDKGINFQNMSSSLPLQFLKKKILY